jgi:hypothetical protein
MKNFCFIYLLLFTCAVNAQTFTVNSLSDDGSVGTLRWAILQANSNADANIIDFDPSLTGTITLTSNLPNVTANLNIAGSGKEKITISGNNLYTMFTINTSVVFSISSFTLTKAGSGDGSIISSNSSTATADDVLVKENIYSTLFNSMSDNSYLTVKNSEFSNNSSLIFFSDHGNTPAGTESDLAYSNRITVFKSKFLNNTDQLFSTERYVKIDECEFTGNRSGIGSFYGVNRLQVLNSKFTNNLSTLFSYSSWLTDDNTNTWIQTLGSNNFLFHNNIFEGSTGTVIHTGSPNNDLKTTITNNTFINNRTNWTGTPIAISNNYLDNFISSVQYENNNNTIVVNLSKPVFSNFNSIGNVDINDFQFELTGGNVTLASSNPSSFSKNGNTISLGIQLNGVLSGVEVLKVIPIANSIYDAGNNIASTFQRNNSLNPVAFGSEGKILLWGKCLNISTSDFTFTYRNPIITSFSPQKINSGGIIEIFGSNFLGATKVNFGGVEAQNFSIESDNKIIANVGYGATGSVGVMNPKKTGFLAGFTFESSATKATISGTEIINNIPKSTFTVIDSTIVVTSDGTIYGAKIQVTGGFVSGQFGDILKFQGTLPENFSLNYNSDKGLLSIFGTGSASVWQSILRKVAIKTTNSVCYAEQRLVTFNLGDKLYNPNTKHWYEYTPYTYSWLNSKASAANRTYFGKVGYLATVTSQEENNFIGKFLASGDSWLGGSDNFEEINKAIGRSIYANKEASEGKYYWVTGPESGTQFSEGDNSNLTKLPMQYSNWRGGEPNGQGSESYLHYYTDGTWNDLSNVNWYLGTVTEYGGLPGDDTSSILNFTKELKIQGSNTGSITGAGLNVCADSNSTLLSLSGNTGAIIRWESSLDNFYTNGVHINNTSSTLLVENLTETTYYRAIVSCNSIEVNTSSVAISVNRAISGNIKAENSTVCLGGNVKFVLSGNQGDVIKWQVSTDENVWTDISNTTNFLSMIAENQGTFYYRAVVQKQGCGNAVYTPNYPITIQSGQLPVGGTITDQRVSNDGYMFGNLILTGHTGNVIKWQSSTNGRLTWDDININTDTLYYNYINYSKEYRAVVVNGTCGSAYSSVLPVIYVPNTAAYYIGLKYNNC